MLVFLSPGEEKGRQEKFGRLSSLVIPVTIIIVSLLLTPAAIKRGYWNRRTVYEMETIIPRTTIDKRSSLNGEGPARDRAFRWSRGQTRMVPEDGWRNNRPVITASKVINRLARPWNADDREPAS